MNDKSFIRRWALTELGLLALLAPLFLIFAPRQSGLYIGMALLFLVYIVLSARVTHKKIWAKLQIRDKKHKKPWYEVCIFTLPIVCVFIILGIIKGYEINYFNLILCLGFYLPWALLQQTIFQFHFFSRLLAAWPEGRPQLLIFINGLIYGLVHLPQFWLAGLTIAAGVIWSHFYLRHQQLLPVAMSHALLGTTYYYFVIGEDLFAHLQHSLMS